MINCLAVDDEIHALELLSLYCEKHPQLNLVHKTTSPWEAKTILEEAAVDLVFLDIQMPELTGLQLLDLVETKAAVIITSAYAQFAIDGYRYQVTDYLLKPFSFDRFQQAIQLVSQHSAANQPASDSNAIYLKGDSKNSVHKVSPDDILYVEGMKNYVKYFLKNERVITHSTLKDTEELLAPYGMVRIHKSYIVNIKCITKIEGNTVRINDLSLPIGRNYKDTLFQLIGLS